jgi:CheY-like chemotaxis protein
LKTILVLEDDAAVMNMFRDILSAYTIVGATTAEEALYKCVQNGQRPDLMIADVILRVGSGIHAALVLRQVLPELPVILTSGYPKSMWSDRDN